VLGEASVGSPHYMSPEQMSRPDTVDTKSDVWSLGVVLFELLTNETPFAGETLPIVFARVIGGEPTPLASFRADLPPGLQEIISRCLARKPSDRFSSVAELGAALSAFSASTSNAATSNVVPPPQSAAEPSDPEVTIEYDIELDFPLDIPAAALPPVRRARSSRIMARAGLLAAACACAAAAAFGVEHQTWALETTASAVQRVRSATVEAQALGSRWVPGLREVLSIGRGPERASELSEE
jgi:serine/threonine-protein kinase